MKAFKFTLETVLQYKKQVEEEKRRELALSRKKTVEQQNKIDSVRKTISGANDDLKKLVCASVRIPDVLAQKRYIRFMENRLQVARNELKNLKLQEAQKRSALIKASKERKILDKLKEKKYKDYLYQANLEERKFLDEIATIKFCNSLNSAQGVQYV